MFISIIKYSAKVIFFHLKIQALGACFFKKTLPGIQVLKEVFPYQKPSKLEIPFFILNTN